MRTILNPQSDSPALAVPGVRRRFIELLETKPGKAELIEFLKLHPDILASALGIRFPSFVLDPARFDLAESPFTAHASVPLAQWSPPFGQRETGFAFDFYAGNSQPTTQTVDWQLVVLNTPTTHILDASGALNPLIERQIEHIKQFYRHPTTTDAPPWNAASRAAHNTAESRSPLDSSPITPSEELSGFLLLSSENLATTIVAGRRA